MSRYDRFLAPHDPSSVEETVRRRTQFDEAMIRSRDELLSYLRRRTRDAETAADLAQETFSRMMVYRDAPNIENHALLMYRIAHNLVLELQRSGYRRHAARHVPLSSAGPLCADESPVEEIANARLSLDLLLKRTLLELPPKCRLAFKLSRFDGLTYPQVAAKMGISVKMVEKHISRALLACRAAVGDRDE
ncbi:RNA polymerase sigma factor [Pseudoxanthomonas sp. UTMC 1351]|uniref:RNA polymerase sigma factor n=1 Tax=Pseudoxanthomonas sp. UTMC 1351 TaxID=2695853 RepID=UPI0034CE9BA3